MPYHLSYWEQKHLLPTADITIVGAGIVGLSCARVIAEQCPSKRVVVIESHIVGAAASTRNAGFACFGSVSELVADRERYGDSELAKIIAKRKRGIDHLLKTFGRSKLAYENCGGWEAFRTKEEFVKVSDQIEDIQDFCRKAINIRPFEITKATAPGRLHPFMIKNQYEGALDTGRLYQCLVEDANRHNVHIIRGGRVTHYEESDTGVEIFMDFLEAPLVTDQLILCTNALSSDVLPEADVTAVRNHVLVTEPIADLKVYGTFHMDEGYVYWRHIDSRILIGGGRHRFPSEATSHYGRDEAVLQYLLGLITDWILPESVPVHLAHSWTGILCGGQDRRPIVKKVSDRVVAAVRLGGMGVAIGSLIGAEAATLAMDKALEP